MNVLTHFQYGMRTVSDRKAGTIVPPMGTEAETLVVLDGAPTSDNFVFCEELSSVIRQTVSKEDAQILFLTADGMSRKEVAEDVGKTEQQVARSLFKSRQKLRSLLLSQI